MSSYVIVLGLGQPNEVLMGTAQSAETAEFIAADLRSQEEFAGQSIVVREAGEYREHEAARTSRMMMKTSGWLAPDPSMT
jgi:hypothetical protein